MTTITVPKKLEKEKELVVLPRREYEQLLEIKKTLDITKPTKLELRAITRGRKEMREGKYISWHELKRELENFHR